MVAKAASAAEKQSTPTRRTFRDLSRASIFACAGVLAALNGQAGDLFHRYQVGGLTTAVFDLGGISVVVWFAMYAALKIGFEDVGEELRTYDLPILTLVVLLTFAPVSIAARGALVLSAFYLLITSGPDLPERRVAFLLMALTGPLVFGPTLLALMPQPVLSLDAHLVGLLIGMPAHANVVPLVTGGNEFVVASGCSSVHNMSLALVLWTTAAVLFRVRIDGRYVAVGLAMVTLMFVLNVARMGAIGMFPADYESLHVGAGGALFAWAGLLGSGMLAAVGVLRAKPTS